MHQCKVTKGKNLIPRREVMADPSAHFAYSSFLLWLHLLTRGAIAQNQSDAASAMKSESHAVYKNETNHTHSSYTSQSSDMSPFARRSSTGQVYIQNFTSVKVEDLTVLISITSGPAHNHLRNAARETWLLPCKASPTCDYRFFVDKVLANITIELIQENISHADLVFRDPSWCPLMARHPYDKLNYGNVFQHPWVYGGGGVPYYQFRGIYKVDWKICFTKWAKTFNKMAHYHVYVEDDSFVCTENLMYQMTLLRGLPPEKKGNPFRTGLPMWDGFDDSSTIMSSEIATAFAEHYPEPGFNCSHLVDQGNPGLLTWLSWGNSWKGGNCGWRESLQAQLNITISTPLVSKQFLPCIPFPQAVHSLLNKTAVPSVAPTPGPTMNYTKFTFPCRDAMILHHGVAGDIVLNHHKDVPPDPDNPITKHACEYMLLIDKVKDASQIHKLWNHTTASNYIDMSVVFTYDGGEGWIHLLDMLAKIERHCYRGDPNPPADCLTWKREQRRRNLKLSEVIYSHGATYSPSSSTAAGSNSGGGRNKDGEEINHRRRKLRMASAAALTASTADRHLQSVNNTDKKGVNYMYHIDRIENENEKESKIEIEESEYIHRPRPSRMSYSETEGTGDLSEAETDNPGFRVYFSDIIHELHLMGLL